MAAVQYTACLHGCCLAAWLPSAARRVLLENWGAAYDRRINGKVYRVLRLCTNHLALGTPAQYSE